jgi:hypothetical protein
MALKLNSTLRSSLAALNFQFDVLGVLEGAVTFVAMVSGRCNAEIVVCFDSVIQVLINAVGVPLQISHMRHLLLMKQMMTLKSTIQTPNLMKVQILIQMQQLLHSRLILR